MSLMHLIPMMQTCPVLIALYIVGNLLLWKKSWNTFHCYCAVADIPVNFYLYAENNLIFASFKVPSQSSQKRKSFYGSRGKGVRKIKGTRSLKKTLEKPFHSKQNISQLTEMPLNSFSTERSSSWSKTEDKKHFVEHWTIVSEDHLVILVLSQGFYIIEMPAKYTRSTVPALTPMVGTGLPK